jgi:AraC-like DNA-binding protein
MQLTFTYGPDKILVNQPHNPHGVLALKEKTAEMAEEWGIFRVKESWFSNACLLLCDYQLNAPCAIYLQCDSFCWMMSFVLTGEFTTETDDGVFVLGEGRYHAGYFDQFNSKLAITGNTKVLTICLSQDFIKKLPGHMLLAAEFKKGITGTFSNGRFHMLVNEILQARQSPFIRHFFFEAKVLELLALQLESLERRRELPDNLGTDDVGRLQLARDIIAKNLKTPYSLLELSRLCGLNDFKLKQGFKQLYGTTVFGYLAELRMKQAYQLLTDGASVGSVAYQVGYKNPQHFTTAFKKKYGILSSQVIGIGHK